MNAFRQLWVVFAVVRLAQASSVDRLITESDRQEKGVAPIHSMLDTAAVKSVPIDSVTTIRSDSGSGDRVRPFAGSPLHGPSHSDGGHFRLGLHGSRKDVGLLMGCAIGWGRIETGVDFWIRPARYVQEIQLTSTHRAQFKELLYGLAPWIEYWLFPRSEWDLALTSSLEVAGGDWQGTSKGPGSEALAAFGVKVATPTVFQLALRRSFSDGLLGPWRGELVCEF